MHKAKETVGKGAGGDHIRYIDVLAEDITIKALEKSTVSCTLVSEECTTKLIGEKPKGYVVLDSIDRTINALHGIPFFCTSITYSKGPKLSNITTGLVMDLSSQITFSAEKGRRAQQEKIPFKPTSTTSVEEILINVELSLQKNREQILHLIPLMTSTKKIRNPVATTLEICYVDSGALDAFVDKCNLTRATDLATAYLILKEASGIMVTPKGVDVDIELKATERNPLIAAPNPLLCDKILKLLGKLNVRT